MINVVSVMVKVSRLLFSIGSSVLGMVWCFSCVKVYGCLVSSIMLSMLVVSISIML